jgi:hypothetical protein
MFSSKRKSDPDLFPLTLGYSTYNVGIKSLYKNVFHVVSQLLNQRGQVPRLLILQVEESNCFNHPGRGNGHQHKTE